MEDNTAKGAAAAELTFQCLTGLASDQEQTKPDWYTYAKKLESTLDPDQPVPSSTDLQKYFQSLLVEE